MEDEALRVLALTSHLQTMATDIVKDDTIRGIWPLVQINVWGREQVRVLAVTESKLYRLKLDNGKLKLCEAVDLTDVLFLVKGYMSYPERSIVHALSGETVGRTFGFRLYYNGTEEHRTFRALAIADEIGMRSIVLQVIEDLQAAIRATGNSSFFIADRDILLSARLGPFTYLTNRLRPAELRADEVLEPGG